MKDEARADGGAAVTCWITQRSTLVPMQGPLLQALKLGSGFAVGFPAASNATVSPWLKLGAQPTPATQFPPGYLIVAPAAPSPPRLSANE